MSDDFCDVCYSTVTSLSGAMLLGLICGATRVRV
jgi:hypothetical protein